MTTESKQEPIRSVTTQGQPTRRNVLAMAGAGGTLGALLAIAGPSAFTAHAAPFRPKDSPMVPGDEALTM